MGVWTSRKTAHTRMYRPSRADTRPLTDADCVYCGSDMDRTPARDQPKCCAKCWPDYLDGAQRANRQRRTPRPDPIARVACRLG